LIKYIKDKLKVIGRYEIFENGKKIKEFNNLITNILLDEMIGVLAGYVPNIDIRYLAIGTDNSAVAADDIVLGTEFARTAYTSRGITSPPTYGEVVTDFYLSAGEGNITIEELGIFGGNAATEEVDSGNLISHVLWNYTKTSSVELLIRYTVTLS
jgi:hypothetical protein